MKHPRSIGRRLSLVVGVTLMISLLAPRAALAWTPAEADFSWMINRWDRAPRGLPALSLQNFLVWRARQHSYQMMKAGRLYHSDLRLTPGSWRTLGENVGVGRSLRELNTAFMNSPAHRANILCRCFKLTGIGVVRDSQGNFWVTQIFWG